MAEIYVAIPGLMGDAPDAETGEVTIDTDPDDTMQAIAVSDVIVGPLGTAKGALSEVVLTRYRDNSSPHLMLACSKGNNIGTATIEVRENNAAYLTYVLGVTYVSRYESETVDATGGAYLPHKGYSNVGRVAKFDFGGAAKEVSRANPVPIYELPRYGFTERELERVWLNFKTISWSYKLPPTSETPNPGSIMKNWSLATHRSF